MLKGIIALTDEDFSWNASGFILNHHVKLYLSQLLKWNGFRFLMMRMEGRYRLGSCRSIVVQVKEAQPVVFPSISSCLHQLLVKHWE